jgi:Golgi phosphoprotein 3 GPP34
VDVAGLASSGATAIISAMATETWSWVRGEVARLFARRDSGREREEAARLDGFADDLSRAAERDVHNRLLGYLEARLSDEVALRNEFLGLVRRICTEVGLDPPTLRADQRVVATNSVVVQTAGGAAQVTVSPAPAIVIRWAAMTGEEAARKLEQMDLVDAVEALTDMEPALAARRLSHVRLDRAQLLLAHMDEGLASDLLSKLASASHAAALLASIEPARAAAILDLTNADWTVARLAEMDPDRALVLLASMGTKRTDDLLAAMERQQTVRLLSAVSKVLSDQARVRTTFDLAQQEAEQIAAQARQHAQETIDQAKAEAAAIVAAARHETDPDAVAEPAIGQSDVDNTGLRVAIVDDSVAVAPGRVEVANGFDPRMLTAADFTLPTEFFLISHDSDGRPRIDQSVLETGIVGAALCELVRTNLATIVDGHPRPVGDRRCPDPVCEFALRTLATPTPQTIATWARNIRKELFHRLAQSLADSGLVIPIAKTMPWFRAGVRYKATSDTVASEPAVRIVRHFLTSGEPPQERTYLLAALINIAQLHHALPMKLRQKQIRELLEGLLKATNPSQELRAVLSGIDSATATIIMTPQVH